MRMVLGAAKSSFSPPPFLFFLSSSFSFRRILDQRSGLISLTKEDKESFGRSQGEPSVTHRRLTRIIVKGGGITGTRVGEGFFEKALIGLFLRKRTLRKITGKIPNNFSWSVVPGAPMVTE